MARQDSIQLKIEFLTDEAKNLAKTTLDINKLNDAIAVQEKEIASLQKEYDKLSAKKTKTEAQEKRLIELQNQISDGNKKVAESVREIAKNAGDISKIDLKKVAPVQLEQILKGIRTQMKGLVQTAPEFEQLAKSEKAVADQLAEIRKNAKGAGEAISNIKSTAVGVGVTIEGIVAKFGAIGAVVGIVIGAVTALFRTINGAADLEQTTIAFETFLGSAEKAKALMNDLRKFAKITPLEDEQVIKGGRALAAFGFQTEKIISTMRRLGDVASGTGKDFNELILIYGKAKASGKIQGDDLNQLAEAGIPIYEELGKVLGVNAEKIRKLGEDGKINFGDLEKVFANLTNEGGRFSGLMERQSQSFTGLMSTLKGAISELGTNLGDAFLPVLKIIVSKLIPTMESIGTALKPVFEIVGVKLVQGFSFLGEKIKPVIDAYKNLYHAITDNINAAPFFDNILKGIGGALTLVGNTVSSVVNYLANMVRQFREFYDSSPLFQKTMGFIAESMIRPIKTITQLVAYTNGLVEAVKAAHEKMGGYFDAIIAKFNTISASINATLTGNDASAYIAEQNKKLEDANRRAGKNIGDAFSKGYNDALSNATKEQAAQAKEAVKKQNVTETRKLESDGKAAKEAKKIKEEQFKASLQGLEGYYLREEAINESNFLRHQITEADFARKNATIEKERYEEQLSLYTKYGKQKSLEAIKIGNKLIEVEARLAPRAKLDVPAQLGTLAPKQVKTDENSFVKDGLRLANLQSDAELKILTQKLADGTILEKNMGLRKLELKRDLLEQEAIILRQGSEKEIELAQKKEVQKLEIEQQIAEKRIDNTRREEDMKAQLIQSSLRAMGDLFNAAADWLARDEKNKKKNAKQVKDLQRAGVYISGIQEVASVWLHAAANPLNTLIPGAGYALAAVQTATAVYRTQLALDKIDNTKFARGGYTGFGGRKDETGFAVRGWAHEGEWYAPKWMVENPKFAPVIHALEKDRMRGFAVGGYTTTPTAGVSNLYQQTITNNAPTFNNRDVTDSIDRLGNKIENMHGRLKVVYTDIEGVKVAYDSAKRNASF